MDIPFEELEFRIMQDGDEVSSFSCYHTDLDDFLHHDAIVNQISRFSVAHLVYWQDSHVGFFTLLTDCIKKDDIHNKDQPSEFTYKEYPALKIARLAVDRNYSRRDIGTGIIKK